MKPYLSDVIDVTEYKKGQANVIIAPCHSGKTTAAGKIIEAHASCPERALFLIDTTAGKQALLTKEDAKRYTTRWQKDLKSEWWGSLQDGDGFRVMTYHQFGMEVAKRPDFFVGLELIVCDEMHNLFTYIGIEKANNAKNHTEVMCCQTALEQLVKASKNLDKNSPLIVIMSATANRIILELAHSGVEVVPFDYSAKVRCDASQEVIYYSDLNNVLAGLGDYERTLIYAPQISQVQSCMSAVDDGWRKVCGLWSIHNEEHPMDEEQLKIRDELIKTERIPKDIDILIINGAYETSINIRNEDYQTVVVHTADVDKQVQVRGRIRHDIQKLYLYDSNHQHVAEYFPKEYYSRPLFVADQKQLVELMQLKNDKGRLLQWSSIKDLLRKDGLTVNPIKSNGRRAWIVYPK